MGSCVEVAMTPSRVFLRDSKQHDLSDHRVIGIDSSAWRDLTGELELGHSEIDCAGIMITSSNDGSITVSDTGEHTTLRLDRHEWNAFTSAVADGEFL